MFNSIDKNPILNSDSYKFSQAPQYPQGTEYIYSYIESRGGDWDSTVVLGLQAYMREYMNEPINQKQIDFADEFLKAHGEPFFREGWEYILKEHKGWLPLRIRGADEGLVIPTQNVLVDVINTDPKCAFATSPLETSLLRGIWYPTTVATNSYESKKIILKYLEETGDLALIDFKLHDFGARGVSSFESAGLGGMAHLVNFKGTDTITGILAAMKYYDAPVCGFSIPAMEHSTVTSWERENEVEAYRNMLKLYGRPGSLLACVSDSYDIMNACRMWGTELKDEVLASGATVVIRPDSGEPSSIVVECLRILDQYFGSTVNSKGYRVLNPAVRVIQGDGIDHTSIRSILFSAKVAGYSADNIAFGQGGALLQIINRDTQRWAMKCSAARVNGVWRDVYKDPITDSGKRSKRGVLQLIKDADGKYQTVRENAEDTIKFERKTPSSSLLKVRYQNGKFYNETNFDKVRTNASAFLM